MSDFTKVAIYVDSDKINASIQTQEYRIEYFQELVNRYVALNTGEPLQKNDLTALIANPKEFVAKRLIKDEAVNMGGLKLSLEKVFDIIEKPAGTEELINKIINDNKIKELMITQRNVSYFEIENSDTVVLNQIFLKTTTENSSVYICTENEIKDYEVLNLIAENLNKLNDLKTHGHLNELLYEGFLNINNSTGSVAVNPYFGKLIH